MSSSEVIAAGNRGKEIVISSQPSTCEVSASSTSQPAAGPGRDEIGIADHDPDHRRHHGGGRRCVEQRTGRPTQVDPAATEQQQEADIGDSGADAKHRSGRRVAAVGAVLGDAGDQDHAEQRDRQRHHHLPARAFGQQQPGDERHQHDLNVRQHGRQAGADVFDRVVPENQVRAPETPRGDGRATVMPGTGAVVCGPRATPAAPAAAARTRTGRSQRSTARRG